MYYFLRVEISQHACWCFMQNEEREGGGGERTHKVSLRSVDFITFRAL